MKKSGKILIISISVLLVIGICAGAFLIFNPFKKTESNTSEEIPMDRSDENYKVFGEGFTDIKVTDEKSAKSAVAPITEALGINDIEKELKVVRADSVDGDTFYRMQQYYNDIPVYGRDVVLTADDDGTVVEITSNTLKIKDNLQTTSADKPSIDQNAFETTVKSYFTDSEQFDVDEFIISKVTDDDLVWYSFDNQGLNTLAYCKTIIFLTDGSLRRYEIIYNPEKNEIVSANETLNWAGNSVEVKGKEKDARATGWLENNTYSLYNDEYKISVFDFSEFDINQFRDKDPKSNFHEYNIPVVSSEDNSFEDNYIYFLSTLSSIAGYYKDLEDDGFSTFHIALNGHPESDNAAGGSEWVNDKCYGIILFGKEVHGNDIDTIGHEYTHAVSRKIVKWFDQAQSGSVNEAVSDIFGCLIEKKLKKLKNPDWKIDMDHLKKNKVVRNIIDPSETNNKSVWNRETFTKDEKYTYSTVISHAAYLMNNGINGNKEKKIDDELLAKIWYKALYLLHPDATFMQCADAVYDAAKMSNLSAKQLVCIQEAFDQAGLPVKRTLSETAQKGTVVYALDAYGKRYQNYHVSIKETFSGKNVAEADVIDADGYKLDLDEGTYIITVSDNMKGGSDNTYSYAVGIIPALRSNHNSHIDILTDYFFDYETPLNDKLNDLISEYGVASTETYTANENVISDKSWTHREGIVSAELSDLDGDGINELVVVRLIDGEVNAYSENLEFSVYYSSYEGVKSAGSVKYLTGDDFTQKDIDSFIGKIGNNKYIFIETDFGMYGTDGSRENAYTVLEYENRELSKKTRVYFEDDYDDIKYFTKWIEITWEGDEEEKNVIFESEYSGNGQNNTTTRGEYKDSKDPVKDYFINYGLSSTEDHFPLSGITRFFNSDNAEKLFEYVLSRGPDFRYVKSTLMDYTELDHSKATTSADKAEEWKELYIDFFSQQENKSALDYATFNFVDVDENGTPELVYTGFAAMGTHIVWIKDGEVQDQAVGYGEFKYNPSNKQIYCQSVNHGMINDNVYSFMDQDLMIVFSGQILPKENGFENPGWSVNGENVSEAEYNSQLNSSFDFDTSESLDYEDAINGSELLSRIKNY